MNVGFSKYNKMYAIISSYYENNLPDCDDGGFFFSF